MGNAAIPGLVAVCNEMIDELTKQMRDVEERFNLAAREWTQREREFEESLDDIEGEIRDLITTRTTLERLNK